MAKINVKAKPNSREEKVEETEEDFFIVSVREPPVKGLANKAILSALAKYFQKPVSSFKIISGYTSRNKIIEID